MINEENLNKLYEGLIQEKELTTKELNSYGFNSKDLKELIEQGKIERVKRGYYKFIDINSLYNYGKQLNIRKEHDKAYLYYKMCYELDPNHLLTVYKLFIQSIKDKDYNESFKYLEILLNTKNNFYLPDYNLYLYLLSFITDIPEKYQEYTKNIKLEDIGLLSKDRRYKDIQTQQRIRHAIIQRKFSYALKQLNALTKKNNENTIEDVIMRVLVIEALETEQKDKEIVLNLIKDKQYEKAILHLQEKNKRHNLHNFEEYTIKLSEVLLDIQKTNVIPTKHIEEADQVYNAIDGCNYELALKLITKHNQEYNIDNNTSIIYLLLNKICNLIKEISKEEQDRLKEIQKDSVQKVENDVSAVFTNIINYLITNDIDNAINTLSEYLTLINKNEYEFLIVNLIKLSLIGNDITFTKSIVTLTNISRNNYTFDVSNYIQEFFLALSQNKFEEAKIYLNIINNAKTLGQNCVSVESLSYILEKAQETVNKRLIENQIEEKNHDIVVSTENIVDSEVKEGIDETETYTAEVEEDNYQDNVVDDSSLEKQQTHEIRDNEKKFIESKYQQLLNRRGIILLKTMDRERRHRIYDIVKSEYPDMRAFSIGEGEYKPVILRYKPCIEGYVNFKQLLSDGDRAYTYKDYDKCIECYLQLLYFGKPKPNVYAKLGLAYMKKFDKEKAIEYLTVATILSKEEGGKLDYTELIDSLKGIANPDKKPRSNVKEKEFTNDLDDYYGLDNFAQINEYIIASGLDVDTACEELNLNEEQRTIVKLLYAREYYSQGEYTIGDLFLQSVERTKNKSKFVQKKLEEVRNGKRFYINRVQKQPKKLSLTLKLKK